MGSYTTDGWQGKKGKEWLANIQPLEEMLSQFNPYIVNSIKIDSPIKVADIGCGGGSTSFSLLKSLPSESEVHGYDISTSLVSYAQEKYKKESHLHFFCEDAVSIKNANNDYNLLTSRFGIMFFQDEAQAFEKLQTLLAPGGKFTFLVWGDHTQNPWIVGIREIVQEFVELPEINLDVPGPFRYSQADKFSKLLKHCGFSEVSIETQNGLLPIAGGVNSTQAAQFALNAFSTYREATTHLSENQQKSLFEKVKAFYAKFESKGKVLVDYQTHMVTGM